MEEEVNCEELMELDQSHMKSPFDVIGLGTAEINLPRPPRLPRTDRLDRGGGGGNRTLGADGGTPPSNHILMDIRRSYHTCQIQ